MRLTTAKYPLNKGVPRNLLKKNQSYFIKQEKFKNIINNNLTRLNILETILFRLIILMIEYCVACNNNCLYIEYI